MIDRRIVLDLWERRDDPNAAMALLAVSNEYVKAGKPFPLLLAHWYSQAIERALTTRTHGNGKRIEQERVSAYTRALGMLRSNNAPMAFISKFFVALSILEQGDDYCETATRRSVEAEFDVSSNTARARIREIKHAIDEGRQILRSITDDLTSRNT